MGRFAAELWRSAANEVPRVIYFLPRHWPLRSVLVVWAVCVSYVLVYLRWGAAPVIASHGQLAATTGDIAALAGVMLPLVCGADRLLAWAEARSRRSSGREA